jgi:P27 family predicted phage terminase small subunit
MTPETYLSKRGKEIFKRIEKAIKEQELSKDIDSLDLSALANAYDLHSTASERMNKDGYSQQTKSGYHQVKADFTVWKQTADYIKNNSGKFGLNPESREKIKAFAIKKKEVDPLDSI